MFVFRFFCFFSGGFLVRVVDVLVFFKHWWCYFFSIICNVFDWFCVSLFGLLLFLLFVCFGVGFDDFCTCCFGVAVCFVTFLSSVVDVGCLVFIS